MTAKATQWVQPPSLWIEGEVELPEFDLSDATDEQVVLWMARRGLMPEDERRMALEPKGQNTQ